MEYVHRIVLHVLKRIKLPFQAFVQLSPQNLLYSIERGLSRRLRTEKENLQHYGFVSRLPVGTRVIILPRMGATEKVVLIAEEHQTKITLAEGDVAIERNSGEYVHLRAGQITVNAALTHFTGNVTIAGQLDVDKDITSAQDVSDHTGPMDEMRGTYNTHTHDESGGGTTGTPNQGMS